MTGRAARKARQDTEAITDPVATEAGLRALWTGGSSPPSTLLGRSTKPLADSLAGAAAPAGVTNPYWSIVRWMPSAPGFGFADLVPTVDGMWGLINETHLSAHRDALSFTYSFAIPSPGDITFLIKHLNGQPVIEIGAGTGYWAWQLTQAGVDVLAYDTHQWVNNGRFTHHQYHLVLKGSVEKIAQHPDRVLMLCWPDYNTSFAAEALTAYVGDMLIYIGEGSGGCTGDDQFHNLLDQGWNELAHSRSHINFDGIHSHVGIYQRRTGRKQGT